MGRLYGITDATVLVPLSSEGVQYVTKNTLVVGGGKCSPGGSAGAGNSANVGANNESCAVADSTDAGAAAEEEEAMNSNDDEGSKYEREDDEFEPANTNNPNSNSNSSSGESSLKSSSSGSDSITTSNAASNSDNSNKKDDSRSSKQGQEEEAVAVLTPTGQIQWLLHRKRTIHRQRANLAEDALLRGLVSNQSSSSSSSSSSSKHTWPGESLSLPLSPLLSCSIRETSYPRMLCIFEGAFLSIKVLLNPFRCLPASSSSSSLHFKADASKEAKRYAGNDRQTRKQRPSLWAEARPLGWAHGEAARPKQILTADDVQQLKQG